MALSSGRSLGRHSGVVLAGALLVSSVSSAQVPFRPLLADPKEPQFFASYLFARAPRLAPRLGAVGFGQTLALFDGGDWDLSLAAAALSQFDMASETTDLMNTDYIVGLPVSYRRGRWAGRLRVYHQSSHLGDGYLEHTVVQPFKLSFEAVELLVANSFGHWRAYAGGEYAFQHSPADLRPGVAHGGLEWRDPTPRVNLGRFGTGRLVTALDVKVVEAHRWQVGWSFVTGVEMADPLIGGRNGWNWSVLLKAYAGPTPYGQFYRDEVTSFGLGIGFTL